MEAHAGQERRSESQVGPGSQQGSQPQRPAGGGLGEPREREEARRRAGGQAWERMQCSGRRRRWEEAAAAQVNAGDTPARVPVSPGRPSNKRWDRQRGEEPQEQVGGGGGGGGGGRRWGWEEVGGGLQSRGLLRLPLSQRWAPRSHLPVRFWARLSITLMDRAARIWLVCSPFPQIPAATADLPPLRHGGSEPGYTNIWLWTPARC